MMNKHVSAWLGTAALIASGTAGAASIGFGPSAGNAQIAVGPGTQSIDLVLDLTGVTSFGGGVELSFTGATFLGFARSAAFLTFDTTPGPTDFSGIGDPQGPNPFEIYIGRFDAFTGVINLGTLDIGEVGAGATIQMVVSPVFGEFIDGDGLPIANFGYGTLTAVPLPASVWLFATGMGLIGWRHSRKRQ